MIMRPLAAITLSAVIAGGTWFTVAKTSEEAQRTADGITQQVLEAQKEIHENAQSSVDARTEAAKAQAQADEMIEEADEAIADSLD
jgi:hypothetical protein